jgi:hypothetical protein
MNTQIVVLVALLAAGAVLAASLPVAADAGGTRRRVLLAALAGLVLALLCVGLVSHTLLRHVLQVLPPVLALALLLRRSPHGVAGSVPLFVFWLGLMVSIWSYLLGGFRLFGGTFTAVEILLSIVIGGVSAMGLVAAWRLPTNSGRGSRLAAAVCFSLLQFASFWLSMQPFAAFR